MELQDVDEFGRSPQEDGHHLQKLGLAARVQHEHLPQSDDGQQGGRSTVDEMYNPSPTALDSSRESSLPSVSSCSLALGFSSEDAVLFLAVELLVFSGVG